MLLLYMGFSISLQKSVIIMDGTTYHSKAVGNVENVLFIAKDNIDDHGQQVSLKEI